MSALAGFVHGSHCHRCTILVHRNGFAGTRGAGHLKKGSHKVTRTVGNHVTYNSPHQRPDSWMEPLRLVPCLNAWLGRRASPEQQGQSTRARIPCHAGLSPGPVCHVGRLPAVPCALANTRLVSTLLPARGQWLVGLHLAEGGWPTQDT